MSRVRPLHLTDGEAVAAPLVERLAPLEAPEAEALTLVDGVKELTGESQLGRGKILEQLGRYEEAWQEFVAAKRKLAAAAKASSGTKAVTKKAATKKPTTKKATIPKKVASRK